MKKVQNNRHTMHLSTQSVLNQNVTKLLSIPGYLNLKVTLDNSIAKEKELDADQFAHKNYRALPKNLARNAAGEYTLDLASKVSSLALIAEDSSLFEEAKLTATEISRLKDTLLVFTIQNIINYATKNLVALSGYGVTSETLSEGTALLETYKYEILQLSKIKNELTVLTQLLEEQIRKTLAIIHKIDSIIETKRVSDPELHSLYWIARAKRNSACTKVSVKGVVFEEATGEPLPGAILTVVRTATTGDELVKKIRIRSANGGFQFSLLTTGKYIFKVTYAGCISREFTVYFNEGILTHVELPMIRID